MSWTDVQLGIKKGDQSGERLCKGSAQGHVDGVRPGVLDSPGGHECCGVLQQLSSQPSSGHPANPPARDHDQIFARMLWLKLKAPSTSCTCPARACKDNHMVIDGTFLTSESGVRAEDAVEQLL